MCGFKQLCCISLTITYLTKCLGPQVTFPVPKKYPTHDRQIMLDYKHFLNGLNTGNEGLEMKKQTGE